MRRFWQWRGGSFGLGREPRAEAPEAPREFVRNLAAHVHEARQSTRGSRLRLAFAGALSLVLLVALAGFGGVGYASDGFKSTWKKVVSAKIVGKTKIAGNKQSRSRKARYSPAHGQYERECRRRVHELERALHEHQRGENRANHEHQRQERRDLDAHQRAERQALDAHQTDANHPGMTRRQRQQHYQDENETLRNHQHAEDRAQRDHQRGEDETLRQHQDAERDQLREERRRCRDEHRH